MSRIASLSDYRQPQPLPMYNGVPASGNNWVQRSCPNRVALWPFTWDSYRLDFARHDKVLLLRRLSMWATLLARAIFDVWPLPRAATSLWVLSVLIGIIMAAIDFYFIAQCLAKIGDAVGRRRVLGVMVGRKEFDFFLGFCAVFHVAGLLGFLMGMNSTEVGGSWVVMWLLIFGVAWVSTWDAEDSELFI